MDRILHRQKGRGHRGFHTRLDSFGSREMRCGMRGGMSLRSWHLKRISSNVVSVIVVVSCGPNVAVCANAGMITKTVRRDVLLQMIILNI